LLEELLFRGATVTRLLNFALCLLTVENSLPMGQSELCLLTVENSLPMGRVILEAMTL